MDSIKLNIFSSFLEIEQLLKNKNNDNGYDNNINESGDNVHKLDLEANKIIVKNLSKCNEVYGIASEEESELILLKENKKKYLVSFDPLDGSQNIDPGLNIGTIFCIFKISNDENLINNGRDIICAGYALFGINTQIIIAENSNVEYFNIINNELTKKKLTSKLESKELGKYYQINEANRNKWMNGDIINLISCLIKKGLSCRWNGCMVSDIHRLIIQGGMFSYPRDSKNKSGKLRLLYECYPMAYIIEALNGYALIESNDNLNILDYKFSINKLHEKVPVIFLGNEENKIYKKIN